jgi:RND family efflux transporter MFP subunit
MTRTTALVLPLVLAAAGSACSGDHEPPQAHARPAVPVTTVRASQVELAEPLEAGGVIAARESALLSSRVVAVILDVHVRAGDRVRAGQVLVTLDARDVADQARQAAAGALAAEKGLARARSEQAAAEAEHRLAQAWHARISALHARNSATAQERDEADARLASAAARLRGAEATIEAADAHVASARAGAGAAATIESFTIIRAPFDGLVTERLMDPGNLASPGVPLLQVESAGARQVEVTADEARAAYINPGDRVDVLLEPATGRGGGERAVQGTVAEVARAMAADQRAFTVKVALPSGEGVRTGTFARVRFRGAARRALVIPASAVRRTGQVTSVFVLDGAAARLRLVRLGETTAETVEVLAGLDAGEAVVASPPPGLSDGHPVAVQGSPVPEGARP